MPTRGERATDAVVLGASPNALSAARSLGRAGLRVLIAAPTLDRSIRNSRYVERFELLPNNDDSATCAALLELPGTGRRPFLLATGDELALLVAKHQERLSAKYHFVAPTHAVLEKIVNKAELYETARRHGFRHPRFHVVSESTDIEPAVANVPTPCYVKPALGHEWRRVSRTKLERAATPDELRRVLRAFLDKRLTAIALEIIPGADSEVFSVCTYIDRFGNPVGWRTKRKLRQYPLRAGDASSQEVCERPEVAEVGLRLLAVVGHRGAATVEFRRDERDGALVLIEINARTILGQEMITRSGLDVPLIAYHDAIAAPLPTPGRYRRTRWIYLRRDYRAFRELRRDGAITTRQWLVSVLGCNAFAFFALDDPWPLLTRVWAWLKGETRGQA